MGELGELDCEQLYGGMGGGEVYEEWSSRIKAWGRMG